MDFTLDATAQTVSEVIANVLARHTTDWESRFTTAPGGFDASLWSALGESGLLELPLPQSREGEEVDLIGMAPLLTALGSEAAVTPAIGHVAVLTGLAQANALDDVLTALPELASGWAAVAVGRLGGSLTAADASDVVDIRDGNLRGSRSGVLHAEGAAALVVPTTDGVAVIDPNADGVTVQRTTASSGWGEYTVSFDGAAPSHVVPGDTQWLRRNYLAALGAYADGLINGATALTAEHVTNRNQFGHPIGTFQAVQQQIADVYVVARSQHLTSTAAAWRLSEGLDADADLSIVAMWMCSEIPAAMRTLTHLHGGIGVDVTYPLHRYFSIAKDLARLVGGTRSAISTLGHLVANGDQPTS